MPSHQILRLWFYALILAAVLFEIGWYLLARNRSYPWREMLTSVATFALRFPARLLRPRVHHASNTEYLDRNYGGILIVWDRLFGTCAEEHPLTPIVYGLVHPIGSLNPFKILFNEWIAIARDVKRARSWRERLTQLFGRPGDSLASAASRQAGSRFVVAVGAE
jgi:hypothetical protein